MTDIEIWNRLAEELVQVGVETEKLPAIKDWFEHADPSVFAWIQFGEALHDATAGAALGFQLWTAWRRASEPANFDLGYHLILWRSFNKGMTN